MPDQQPSGAGAPDPALNAQRPGPFANLARRARLTVEYLGWRTLLWRALTYPLRFTPLRTRLHLGDWSLVERRKAVGWYREHGRPVTVVIPTYGDPSLVSAAVRSVRRTTDAAKVRIVVADDASGPEHVAALRRIKGIDLVLGERNAGFAANANRGIRAADPAHDVVLLNSDVVATRGWLECLQHEAHYDGDEYDRRVPDAGIVGAKLLYEDGRIQHAGVHRNLGAPEWFDHRHRFKPADHAPAGISGAVLAVTGACMYIRRDLIDEIGLLDEDYPMAYEDVDYCLRAWQAGRPVVYCAPATLYHHESVTRGAEVGDRERASQELFWRRWGDVLDRRDVRTADGRLRVVYVTHDTGVGGGHRDIFEHLNRLAERGHEVALYTLGPAPDWFELRVPVRSFEDYEALTAALASVDAVKVATWWETGPPVWRASVLRGVPVFFVQDIETSYYPDDPRARAEVLAGYRNEFHYMTISGWNSERLGELGLEAELIPPGIDLDTFRPLGLERRTDMLLSLGRTNPLKNLPLTLDAWKALPEPRPELCLFGIEPELGDEHGARYVESPSDEEVAQLLNEATVFVLTSHHEGFALPPLESMATGGAVVCTDAHGNRDFCRDGENCLMPAAEPGAVRDAIARLLADPDLRRRLGEEGIRTAAPYAWPVRIDALETFLARVAGGRGPGREPTCA